MRPHTGVMTPSPFGGPIVDTDALLKGWNPREDAKGLAAAIVNSGKSPVVFGEVETSLGWEKRRLNAAAHALVVDGHAEAIGGDREYDGLAYFAFQVTPGIRRLARTA